MDYQLGPGPLQVDQNTIDEKIKGDIGIVENGDVATHAIPSGYYVIWKGDLYVAKTDISSGTTLSTSNLTAKPNGLGADVTTLNSNIATLNSKFGGGRIKIISLATDGTTSGFKVSYPESAGFIIFYMDNGGRIAMINKGSGYTPEVTEMHGTFEAKSTEANQTYLRVVHWCRADFIIDTIADVNIATYGT